MKESYPDDIMLCFVQGFGDRDRNNSKTRDLERTEHNGTRLSKRREQSKLTVHIESLELNAELSSKDTTPDVIGEPVEIRPRKSQSLVGRSLRLSSADRFLNCLPEVKRSFSDRFSVATDANGKRPSKGLLTIRKTW